MKIVCEFTPEEINALQRIVRMHLCEVPLSNKKYWDKVFNLKIRLDKCNQLFFSDSEEYDVCHACEDPELCKQSLWCLKDEK